MIHDVVIYKANETNFNHEGLGVLIDFVEDVEVTENNRGFFELKFAYSLNGKLAQSIKEEAYIKTVANERQEEPLIFRVYQSEPDYIERLIYVRARLKIIDDMMNSVHKSIIFPKSFGITPIIEGLFKNAVPSLNYRLSGSVNNLHDISHEDDTVYEHLFQENGLFVMNDITPLYTPLGMTVTTARGNKRVDTITEQDFINKFKIIRERKNMITAIIPWTVTKRDEFVANEEDARRSYRDTVEEKVYGEIIVSPKVASHGYPFIAKFMEFKNEVTREWEENNRTMREYKYQSVEDLNKASQNFFTENKGIDEYSIEASIETLGLHMDYMKRLSSLGLYDEVEFYLEEHDLKIVLAVSEVTYSPSLDMNLALTFQSNTSTLSKAGQRINANAPSERDLQNLIERERLKEIVRNYIDKDDGTRTYWVSELPDPSTAMEQDIAFLETAEGKSIWVLINGVWVEKLPLNFEERLRDELERVNTQTKAMEASIQENETKANQALEQAGASADLASEAQRIAGETKQAHASLSQEVNAAKADLVQKGLELSQLTENFGVTERKVEELDGAIKEAVTRTDYDALTGRVSQAETIIQSQAGEIRQRLTRTEVESAITGKGYITNSALTPYATTVSVENKVRETADGINRTITEVRGLIPMEVGGRNYLLNSKTEISVVGSNKAISLSQELLDNLNKIKTVTISCDVEGINVSTNNSRKRFGLSCAVEINGVVNYWEVWQTEDTTKKRISQTFTVPEGKTITKFNTPALWIQAEGNIKVSNPKLEFGVLPTDWSPAPEDNDLNITTKIAEYKQTVDGQFANLSTQYAGKTEFTKVQTTASLAEQIFGATNKDGALTNIAREVLSKDIFQTEIKRLETNADLLARVADGVSVVDDPDFSNGLNGVQVYDNSSSGRVTIAREKNADGTIGQPTNPTSNRLKITHTGIASPNLGGVKLNPLATHYSPNKTFVVEMSALLPVGYSLHLRDNYIGAGGYYKWLTPNQGTGKWERYVGLYQLGTGTINPYVLTYISVSGPTPSTSSPLNWYIQRMDIKDISNSGSQALSTKVTQLAGSWSVQNLTSAGTVLNQINLLADGTNRIDGRLTHITGQTKIDNAVITSAMIQSLDASKITAGTLDAAKARIINLDVNSLTGNKSTFLQSMWRATNSLSYIDGTKIQVRDSAGSYVEMNNVPEFRSSDPTGTATVMGMGRTHYLDKYGTSLGYIGMNLYDFDFGGTRTYAGTKYGVWLSRGSGGFSINYMQDGGYVAGTNNVYYTTKTGETYPVAVIEAVMRYKGNVGNWGNFEWVKSTLSTLNGYGSWPWNTTFQAGDKVIIEKGTLSTYVAAGYQRYLDCTVSSTNKPTIYTYTEVRHQEGVIMEKGMWVKGEARVGSLRNDSDRRLKKNIKTATSSALEELMALKVVEFDWKASIKHQDYGLIAQEAGKFRVPANDEEDTESIDLTRLLHASVKAIQELTERVKELETRTVN